MLLNWYENLRPVLCVHFRNPRQSGDYLCFAGSHGSDQARRLAYGFLRCALTKLRGDKGV